MGKTRVRTKAKTQKGWIKEFESKIANGEYEPFYRTQDITSSGFKARVPCLHNPGRVYHLLSQNETNTLVRLLHDPMVIDIKEQYPVTDLPMSKAFAEALEINHPKHVWSATDSIVTFDFLCEMKFGPNRVISVKPKHLLTHKRTAQKLALEQAVAASMGYEFVVVTDEQVKTEEVKNIFRIIRGAVLPPELVYEYADWRYCFVQLLDERIHSSLHSVIQEIAIEKNISFNDSLTLMQHGFWVHHLHSDPAIPLLPEHSLYYLGVTADA